MAQCRLKSFKRIWIVQSVARFKGRDDHPDNWNDGPENHQESEQVSERLFGQWFHRGYLISCRLRRVSRKAVARKMETTNIVSPMAAAYPKLKKRKAVSYKRIGTVLVASAGPPLVVI